MAKVAAPVSSSSSGRKHPATAVVVNQGTAVVVNQEMAVVVNQGTALTLN